MSSSIALTPFGSGLHRPECVVGTRRGDVFVSDWRGGVTRIDADGTQQSWLARPGQLDLRPNGIAVEPDGAFLIAHLGDTGGVWRLTRDGQLAPVLLEVDGVALPPTNFVVRDDDRLWISVSTRRRPRQDAWRAGVADGFIVLHDARGARIVADGLHYTNEIRVDPAGQWLYAVETFGRRLSRFPLAPGPALGARETVVSFGHGWFPDGFAFDAAGGVWVTSLVSNRVARLHADRLDVVVEELDPAFVDGVERAFAAGTMDATHLGPIPGTQLQHVTSVTFGGADGRTVSLGSLHGRCIHKFVADVPGAAMGPATDLQ